jgi:hypothetical protein
MAEKNILRKAINFLQSGKQDPLLPPVKDISRFFTQYGDQSPLEESLGPSRDQFEGMAQARGFTRTEPEIIPGAESTAIPRMEQMPVGQGSWFNRPKESSLVKSQTMKYNEQDVQRAAEKSAIEKLVAQNPEYFAGRPADTFINIKQAEEFLKNEKRLELENKKLAEAKRKAQAAEKAKAEKEKNPFGATLPSVPTIGATPPAVTAKDVLNKFGIEQ